MFISNKYKILDKSNIAEKINTELCIINFDLVKNYKRLKSIISDNPKTTFWAATNNYSKEYVLSASKLGITNLINFPIKTELIDNFFNTKNPEIKTNQNKEAYEPLKFSKILIVDDNELNIVLLKEILSDLNIEIICCRNPKDALKIISSQKFDLFLLDILMPDISGFELAEYIKQSSLNKSSKIIFISAISGEENQLNGYNLGATTYIEKPFSPEIVKAQIYNILKSEEDKKQNELDKDGFVATLTHDLKSPINAEICALKYLLHKDNSMKNQSTEMLSDLLNSAQYMKLITDKILCHYQQKSQNLKLHKEYTSFNSLILSSIEEMKYLAIDKNITIYFDNHSEYDLVYLDFIEIKRVINNLISNAIEYSKENSRLDIMLENNEDEYTLTVKDYGIGIDLSKYDKICDEYVSLSKQHKKTGFGLGLNISQSILNAHGSNLAIKSALNKGTEMSFKLPISR